MGWLVDTQGQATKRRFAPDLLEDPIMRKINYAFLPLVGLTLAIPAALGFVLTGTLAGALTGLLWGGFVRIFFVHHVTWSINSVCHFFGSRRFDIEDESTNVFWLAIPSLGESWHHNHHAFPRAAKQGLRWWEIDISAAVITLLEKLGLAWDVVRISPERQEQRLAGAADAPARRDRGRLATAARAGRRPGTPRRRRCTPRGSTASPRLGAPLERVEGAEPTFGPSGRAGDPPGAGGDVRAVPHRVRASRAARPASRPR